MERVFSTLLTKPWSAQAFDRILLVLILTVPQIVMFAWLVTNGSGVVERALWLEPAPLDTRLIGTGVWIVVIAVTGLAIAKRGLFVWLWVIVVAAPLYWWAYAPNADDLITITPFLPLAGVFACVGIFSIAEWLCALVLLILEIAFHRVGLWLELVDLNDSLKPGRMYRALTTDGAGFGVLAAAAIWGVSLFAPNVIPFDLFGVFGATFAALLLFLLLRRFRLAFLVFALLSVAPYITVFASNAFGFWPARPQPVLVHMTLMLLIAAPLVWLGYGMSALAARVSTSWLSPVLCAAAAFGVGATLYLVFGMFVNVVPDLLGISMSAQRLSTAHEIWLESWWSWGMVAIAALCTFIGYWCPSRSNVSGEPSAQGIL